MLEHEDEVEALKQARVQCTACSMHTMHHAPCTMHHAPCMALHARLQPSSKPSRTMPHVAPHVVQEVNEQRLKRPPPPLLPPVGQSKGGASGAGGFTTALSLVRLQCPELQQPTRPPTAPKPRPRAQGCPLGPKGAPSPLWSAEVRLLCGVHPGATLVPPWCLPCVTDSDRPLGHPAAAAVQPDAPLGLLSPHVFRLSAHASRLSTHVFRLQPHAPRLQPRASRLQPHVFRLQPHAPRLQLYVSQVQLLLVAMLGLLLGAVGQMPFGASSDAVTGNLGGAGEPWGGVPLGVS